MTAKQQEVEVTLLVRAPAPRHVVQRLVTLQLLGGAPLQPGFDQSLHDVYFDVPDAGRGEMGSTRRTGGSTAGTRGAKQSKPGAMPGERRATLAARGYGLRLRRCRAGPFEPRSIPPDGSPELPGVEWHLCLKRRGERQGLAVRRLEIEGPAHDAALRRRIADETGLPRIATLQPGEDPVHALVDAGFVVIHARCTLRRIRRIVAASGEPLAHLAIDSVEFDVDGTPLWHHEVEIEAESEAGERALPGLALALQEAFPDELVPWRPSKLRTGLALQELVRRVGAAPLLGSQGDLLPEAYDLLRQQLRA